MNTDFLKSHRGILLPSLTILFVHFINNAFTTYGIFRDELYYIACSEHLAWGYVDQPPLCALILKISRSIFGDSVFAVRILPSFAHAATALYSGVITKKMGGERFAQLLSTVSVALAPGIVGMMGLYTMNAFDILLWQITFYLVIRLFETENASLWYWIGFVIGIGLLNKISMGWLAAGIAVGIAATPERRRLKKPQPWIAAAIALFMFLPYIVWNFQNNFAHLEFANNAARLKYASQNPITFFSGMVLLYNPLAIPIWISGFWILLRHERKEYRIIGIAVLTVLAILLVNFNSKSEYFNPAAIILIAAGSLQIERWFGNQMRVIRHMYVSVIVISGFLLMPLAIDILPVQAFIPYAQSFGLAPPNTEGHRMGSLPQHFADRFGWKEFADNVADVYNSLSPDEKKYAAIYVRNYGEAGAIDFFGKDLGLPKAMSGHNNYWIWGKDRLDDTVHILIAVGGDAEDYSDTFGEVTLAGRHVSELAMSYESNLPIYVCRKPKLKIKEVWHTTRRYI